MGNGAQILRFRDVDGDAGIATDWSTNEKSPRYSNGTSAADFRCMSKSKDVRKRSFQFMLDVIAFTRIVVNRDPHLRPVTWQLLDSAGSTGANLEEAAEGQSKRDFIAKNYTALKEARESRFWLRVIAASSEPSRSAASPLIEESSELIAMLVACVKTAKSNPRRGEHP